MPGARTPADAARRPDRQRRTSPGEPSSAPAPCASASPAAASPTGGHRAAPARRGPATPRRAGSTSSRSATSPRRSASASLRSGREGRVPVVLGGCCTLVPGALAGRPRRRSASAGSPTWTATSTSTRETPRRPARPPTSHWRRDRPRPEAAASEPAARWSIRSESCCSVPATRRRPSASAPPSPRDVGISQLPRPRLPARRGPGDGGRRGCRAALAEGGPPLLAAPRRRRDGPGGVPGHRRADARRAHVAELSELIAPLLAHPGLAGWRQPRLLQPREGSRRRLRRRPDRADALRPRPAR